MRRKSKADAETPVTDGLTFSAVFACALCSPALGRRVFAAQPPSGTRLGRIARLAEAADMSIAAQACAAWRGAAFGTSELEDMDGTGGAFAVERSGCFAVAVCVQATAAGSTVGIGLLGASCVAT